MSPPEVRIWARLKRQPDGLRFRRQHPIGPYVADFYCASAYLVIEIEGAVHDLAKVAERDARRTAWLEGEGYFVERIAAAAVMRDPDDVADGLIRLAGRLSVERRMALLSS